MDSRFFLQNILTILIVSSFFIRNIASFFFAPAYKLMGNQYSISV